MTSVIMRNRLKVQPEKRENKESEGELGSWRKRGKIPTKVEPIDKRVREDCESDKEENTPKLRKRKWGEDKKEIWGGKIQNMDEPGVGGVKVKSETVSNRTSDKVYMQKTELNNHTITLTELYGRHRDHGERNVNTIDLKRKIIDKRNEVQEQKGEGV